MKKILEKREHLIIRSEEQLECILLAIKKRHHKVFSNCQFLHVSVLKNLSSGKSYHHFYIPKKNGRKRHISSPFKELKYVQLGLAIMFNSIYRPHENAFGFINNKSIVDNAQKHINKDIIVNIDLKDFFESINYDTLIEKFIRQPYYFSYRIALLLADVLTANVDDKRFLPQGAPSSPILTNMIAYYLDVRLSKFCEKHNITYTRYADDITFSFDNQSYIYWNGKRGVGYKDTIMKIINSEGFEINNRKTRISFKNQRQEVTGLVVNRKVNVKKEYIKHLRCEIHNWEYDGYVIASYKFLKNYERLHGTSKKIAPMENVIDGKLSFIKMVKGKDDSTYIKLKNRYDRLLIRDRAFLEIAQNYPELGNKDAVETRIKELEELISEVQTQEGDKKVNNISSEGETARGETTKSESDLGSNVLTGEIETEYIVEDAKDGRAVPNNSPLIKELRALGAFEFINRNLLNGWAGEYAENTSGAELPINYLVYHGNDNSPLQGKVVLAIDVTTDVGASINPITIGDKKYQVIGVLGTQVNSAEKEEYIRNLYQTIVDSSKQSNSEWDVSTDLHTSLAHINIGRLVTSGKTVDSNGNTVEKSSGEEIDLKEIPGIREAYKKGDWRFAVLMSDGKGKIDFGNERFQTPNTGAKPGTVYLMAFTANGKYYPRGLRVKSVSEVLEKIDNVEKAKENPYLAKVIDCLMAFATESVDADRLRARDKISKNYIYLPENVKLTFTDDSNSGTTEIKIKIGDGITTVAYDEKINKFTEADAFNLLKQLAEQTKEHGEPLRFQINRKELTSSDIYVEDIIDSNILTTNLMQIQNIIPNFLVRKTDLSTGKPITPSNVNSPEGSTPRGWSGPTSNTKEVKVGKKTYTESTDTSNGNVVYYVNGKRVKNKSDQEIVNIIFKNSDNVTTFTSDDGTTFIASKKNNRVTLTVSSDGEWESITREKFNNELREQNKAKTKKAVEVAKRVREKQEKEQRGQTSVKPEEKKTEDDIEKKENKPTPSVSPGPNSSQQEIEYYNPEEASFDGFDDDTTPQVDSETKEIKDFIEKAIEKTKKSKNQADEQESTKWINENKKDLTESIVNVFTLIKEINKESGEDASYEDILSGLTLEMGMSSGQENTAIGKIIEQAFMKNITKINLALIRDAIKGCK